MAGLFVVQVYWFKKAFDVSEMQFDHTVQVALKKVADSVSRTAEVKKLSSNFFFVETNSTLNNQEVDSLLNKEFLIRQLRLDYELGVYNSHDDTLVYGSYVAATEKHSLQHRHQDLMSMQADHKNFAVHFPSKKAYITSQMEVWIFSTIVLLMMMGFFLYAMYSLLREKKFSELKNDFVNNMTHEFKTPVTNIGIAAEILKNKAAARDDINVYLDIVLKENEKLRDKIDQVLLAESLDFRNRRFEMVDVNRLISDCAESFQLKIQERHGNLLLDLSASNSFILGDKDLLSQAIGNIIDNAEKYSVDKPDIAIRTSSTDRGIEVTVVDKGIGIAPAMKSKVFDKFFRVPSGNIHTVKGFGLGLSFVKDIVQSHHGRVSLFSALNKGTEVKITLPQI
jgi:two-component system phosphate regulon sensor histidine kinase PhoR